MRNCLQLSGDERAGKQNRGNALTMSVKSKLIEIRQDQIGKGTNVAFELLGVLSVIEVCVGLFCLDIPDDGMLAVPNAKVGIPSFRLLRK